MTKSERKIISDHAKTLDAAGLKAQVQLFNSLSEGCPSSTRADIYELISEIYANRFGLVLAMAE